MPAGEIASDAAPDLTRQVERERLALNAKVWVAIGAVLILCVSVYALMWLSQESDTMRRELATMGFGALVVVTLVPLVMAMAARRAVTIALATILLCVASAMCLGPMVAWLDQLGENVRELNLLGRPLVKEGLVGLALGGICAVGAAVCLVRMWAVLKQKHDPS